MATRSRGLSACFGWLNRGISVGFRKPKPLFGGAALIMLAALIPTLITLPMQFYALRAGTPMQPATFGWITLLSIPLSLLVLPLYAGYLQVVDAVEHGLPARAGDIAKPYREGKALRLIGYYLVMLVVSLAIFAVVLAAVGGGTVHWYMEVLAAQANHQPPPTALPSGFWITFLLIMVLGIFMMGFHSIGLGQMALSDRSVFGAVGDGLIGTLKNVLPLLTLAVTVVLLWIAVAICFGIVFLVLALLGKLFGPWLMAALMIPLYIALLLTMYTTMFGVMYHLWRDVCGDDDVAGMAQSVAA